MGKYKEYVKKYYYCFLLGPLFMVLEASGEFILPFINARMIDVVQLMEMWLILFKMD